MSRRVPFQIPPTVTANGLGAGAAGAGTAFTNCLRWSPVPVPSDGYITVVDSATDGMSFVLGAPGLYHVSMRLLQAAATTLRTALSINGQPPSGSTMVIGTAGVLAIGGPTVTPAGCNLNNDFSTWIRVGDADVGAVLRTHAADGAGGIATASITTTASANWLRIARIIDCG